MSNHDLSNAQAISGERSDLGTVRVGVLNVFADDSGIDERHDATESGSGGKCGVGTDRWDADDERVEVLLGGNEAASCSDRSIAGSELRDDEIGLGELAARVGGGEEELNRGSGKGGCLAGLSEVGQCRDGGNGPVSLFLAETVKEVRFFFFFLELSRLTSTYQASATAARRAMRTVWVYIVDGVG
jgi:hypothetical protein